MSRTLLFYESSTSTVGDELFVTDGTPGGTTLVQNIAPGAAGSNPQNITATGDGQVIFTADDSTTGRPELFASDGTSAGTGEINGSFVVLPDYTIHIAGSAYSPLGDFTPLGDGEVLFRGTSTPSATQLWVSNGTTAGTRPLANFAASNPFDDIVSGITALGNGKAVFIAQSSVGSGADLWGTDGTSGGTIQLTSTAATVVGGLTSIGLAFALGTDGNGGQLLDVTDGTVAGTQAIHDFAKQTGSYPVTQFTPVGSHQLLFTASDGEAGNELWVTDGTAAGTIRLAASASTASDPQGLNPQGLTRLSNGKVIFSTYGSASQSEVWISDGTAVGTVALADIAAGTAAAYYLPFGNGKALFQVTNYSTDTNTVWATDGTSAGTVALQTFTSASGFTPDVTNVALPNGKALFAVPDGGTGLELWISDGTVAGTYEFADVPQNPNFSPSNFTVLPDGRAVFDLEDASGNTTLWATSGTASSTAPISSAALYGYPTTATVADTDPLFDSTYYLANNPDVAASSISAFQHYLTYGANEGRSPDPLFDSQYYLDQNPDVKASGINPLLHFEQYGASEGRDPSLLFSDSKYLAAYPDVAASGMDPLQHYIEYGQAEGRMTFLSGGSASADPLIDPNYYDPQLGARLIPTGLAAEQQAAYSYNTTGWQQGLNPDPLFNAAYYLANNPDVAAAGINPLQHYEEYGWEEGRDPSAAFDTSDYLAANPDVAAAHVDPLAHYIQFGAAEGRAIYSV